MDRMEAYQLLSDRMAKFESEVALGEFSDNFSLSEEVSGKSEGVFYTIDLRLEQGKRGSISVHGSIHDNNTAKFTLLEERKTIRQ